MKADKTDNETVQEFMGWQLKQIGEGEDQVWIFERHENSKVVGFYSGGNDDYFTKESAVLPFHASYDWLMPVWVKFRDLEFIYNSVHADQQIIDNHDTHRDYCSIIAAAITDGTIQQAFEELVKGVKWYNTLNHTKP